MTCFDFCNCVETIGQIHKDKMTTKRLKCNGNAMEITKKSLSVKRLTLRDIC